MKILSYALAINTLLSVHVSLECMELENVPKTYKTICDLLTSEHYRSEQFSDKIVSFKEGIGLVGKGNCFQFQAHKPYTIINHTINNAKVKKTIDTEFNDQHNQIILKTVHSGFGVDQKYSIAEIKVTILPTQQIKHEPVLPTQTLSVANISRNVLPVLNSNAENTDLENGTVLNKETGDTIISNDCFWPLIVAAYVVLSTPLKKMLNNPTRYVTHLLPTILPLWHQKKLK